MIDGYNSTFPEGNAGCETDYTTGTVSNSTESIAYNTETMNSWERSALQYHFAEPQPAQPSYTLAGPQPRTIAQPDQKWRTEGSYDPSGIIYPGLYSATGFDIMNILIQVATRPNPQIELGPIDGSCSILLCDLQSPDTPVVYASDPFCELTGYAKQEVLGQNCRFLQSPPGSTRKSESQGNADAIKRLGRAVSSCEEIQLEVVNYKKTGERFVNMLSLVPIQWGHDAHRYCVGFLGDVTSTGAERNHSDAEARTHDRK
ncbi:hypothetical protein MKZ38_004979 [Zalerion maritima]|uniref:PAS domain-containing protein n=1 Tax=Zalerion maritima TaxID=339359 RepID=A0AAD5RKX5_9PEZI|nr:hypothetical protein MKZ38_004979 [Zalerion maritima]